jgi:nucleotide-binding universal stress UspA family protein
MEQETDADLKVVGKHETQIAEELLIGSVTQHALAESQCDSLANCDPHDAPKSSP